MATGWISWQEWDSIHPASHRLLERLQSEIAALSADPIRNTMDGKLRRSPLICRAGGGTTCLVVAAPGQHSSVLLRTKLDDMGHTAGLEPGLQLMLSAPEHGYQESEMCFKVSSKPPWCG